MKGGNKNLSKLYRTVQLKERGDQEVRGTGICFSGSRREKEVIGWSEECRGVRRLKEKFEESSTCSQGKGERPGPSGSLHQSQEQRDGKTEGTTMYTKGSDVIKEGDVQGTSRGTLMNTRRRAESKKIPLPLRGERLIEGLSQKGKTSGAKGRDKG